MVYLKRFFTIDWGTDKLGEILRYRSEWQVNLMRFFDVA